MQVFNQINFGIIPGGTSNSLSVALNGKNMYKCCLNIIRNKLVLSDLMEVEIDGIIRIATTAAIYGIVASVTHKAE